MSTDRVRRGATVLALVAILLAVPQLAAAKFFAGATAKQSVSAATLVTPTDVSGKFTCHVGEWAEGISVDVERLGAPGQVAGVSYTYEFVRNGWPWWLGSQKDSNDGRVSFVGGGFNDDAATTWTLRVRAVRGNWESSNLVTTLTCPAAGNPTKSF